MPERLTSPDREGTTSAWLFPLGVLVAYVVAGLVAGLVWEAVWTPPAQVVEHHQVFYADYASLRRVFTGTGLYAIVGAVASAVTTLAVALLTRRRELLTLVLVVVGSVVASVVMYQVGLARSPGDPTDRAAGLPDATHVSGTLTVDGHSPYLVWPMVALAVLALVFFLWSRPRTPSAEESASAADGAPEDGATGVPPR